MLNQVGPLSDVFEMMEKDAFLNFIVLGPRCPLEELLSNKEILGPVNESWSVVFPKKWSTFSTFKTDGLPTDAYEPLEVSMTLWKKNSGSSKNNLHDGPLKLAT